MKPENSRQQKPRAARCPTCGMPENMQAHGWVYASADEDEVVPCPTCAPQFHERRRLARSVAMQEAWPVESRTATYTWDSLLALPGIHREAVVYTQDYTKRVIEAAPRAGQPGQPGLGLLLCGFFGHGKTGMAICALREVIASGFLGGFTRTAAFVDVLRAQFSDGDAGELAKRRIALARDADVLVLDDIGAERLTEFGLEQLILFLDERFNNGRATILTSNFSLEELAEAWGDDAGNMLSHIACGRLINRIAEYCLIAHVRGASQQRPSWKRGSDL